MKTTEKKQFTGTFVKSLGLREFDSMVDLVNAIRKNVKVWSWGARSWTNVENLALRFRVSGHHFKGLVFIVVNGSDLFDVYLTKPTTLEIVDTLKDIYIEDLIDTIDRKDSRV